MTEKQQALVDFLKANEEATVVQKPTISTTKLYVLCIGWLNKERTVGKLDARTVSSLIKRGILKRMSQPCWLSGWLSLCGRSDDRFYILKEGTISSE
jgi:hypothetical protein